MEKACKWCGIIKPLDGFYKHPSMKDGRLNRCIDCFKADQNQRRRDEPEAIRARDRAYWAAHPEAKRAKDRRYKESHRAEHVANATKWNTEHPEAFKTHLFNNYARRHGVEPGHTYEQWQAKLALAGGKCAECGSTERITRDHIVPLTRGGSDHIDNIQPLCRSCNTSKRNRDAAKDKASGVDPAVQRVTGGVGEDDLPPPRQPRRCSPYRRRQAPWFPTSTKSTRSSS